MISQRSWVVALCGLACACEISAELGVYATRDDTTTSFATDTGEPDDSSTAHGGTAGGESGDGDGDGDPQPGDGDGDPTTGDGDGDAQLCMIDIADDPCRTCVKYLCCEHLESCDVESGCNCMLECLAESDPVTCAMTCTPGPAYFQLLQCQVTSCGAVCE